MDVGMLDMILDEYCTYFGASKRVFLEKLSFIFDQYRLGGGSGNLKLKSHKKNKNTFYLLMPVFSFAHKFIIEERNGCIINIYNNKEIRNIEDAVNLGPFQIFFGDDEKADFKTSPDYAMTLYNCTSAYEELVNNDIQVLTSSDVSRWLHKHALLYEKVKDKFLLFGFNNFRNLYTMFKQLLDRLQYHIVCSDALNSFNDSDTNKLNKWLEKYDRLFFCEVQTFEFFFSETDALNKTLKYGWHPNIYFKGDDIFAIVKFNELFLKNCNNYTD